MAESVSKASTAPKARIAHYSVTRACTARPPAWICPLETAQQVMPPNKSKKLQTHYLIFFQVSDFNVLCPGVDDC